MKSLTHYDIKILLALVKSLHGERQFFTYLLNNGYPELAAWSNAVRGDEDALHWLFDSGFEVLGVLSNAIDNEKRAVQWILQSKDEFLINFSAACRQEKGGLRWLRDNDLDVFAIMASEIVIILDTQIKDKMFWYRWK
ncbi:MAG: hypothetical protein LBO06_02915 [Bacteroidales bacterium]|jgi:hypothetical protein|nr:hypothetical protein [Bacteroidales bacterium]